VPTSSIRGGWKVTASARAVGVEHPVHVREWKAWLTRKRLALAKPAASSATAFSSPATTTELGPLTAAMAIPLSSSGSTSRSVARSETIAPPAGIARDQGVPARRPARTRRRA